MILYISHMYEYVVVVVIWLHLCQQIHLPKVQERKIKKYSNLQEASSNVILLCSFLKRFINEDKRKTEGQVQMFEILRDVDGCPVSSVLVLFPGVLLSLYSFSYMIALCLHKLFQGVSLITMYYKDSVETCSKVPLLLYHQANILSSHRVYVTKVDTYEMSDLVVGRGEAVTIFLFSDSLEVGTVYFILFSKKLQDCNQWSRRRACALVS